MTSGCRSGKPEAGGVPPLLSRRARVAPEGGAEETIDRVEAELAAGAVERGITAVRAPRQLQQEVRPG
jgi:hypothetical protein